MQKKLNNDYNLWKRFKEGNDDAFYMLYDQYAENLYKYGSHFSRKKDLVKDCIQELFLDLYLYRKKLSETDNIQFYLFCSLRRIIHKELLKVIRCSNRELNFSLIDNPELSCEDSLILLETEIENHQALNLAMKSLSDRQREGLSLKFEHNCSYAEIAEIMGVTIESARTLIYRALKELRKCFEYKGVTIQLLFNFYRH